MAGLPKDKLIFNVDFNELDSQQGRWVVADRAATLSARVPEPGEEVWLEDDEGNGCPGVIASVRKRTLLIEPDWDRWRGADDLTISPTPSYVGPRVYDFELDKPELVH